MKKDKLGNWKNDQQNRDWKSKDDWNNKWLMTEENKWLIDCKMNEWSKAELRDWINNKKLNHWK